MKQTQSIVSTQSADVFGVCSALFELGGMVVMHDASGCNSTYNTHDEPRWYDTDSLVFVSGISENEAIMGDDNKFIDDIVRAAKSLKPKFIAVAGTPIPMMIGTDFKAIAKVVESKTGIRSFAFDTDGMHTYVSGASQAFEMLAENFVNRECSKEQRSINVLGLTPLDFSVNGTDKSILKLLKENGWNPLSTWSMGCSLDDISHAGEAEINLVVSSTGLKAAKMLKSIFNTPYVLGFPLGDIFKKKVLNDLETAVRENIDMISYDEISDSPSDALIISESVIGRSLCYELNKTTSYNFRLLCPLEAPSECLLKNDVSAYFEDMIIPEISKSKLVLADPLYEPIIDGKSRYLSLPSESFSGRLYREDIINLCENFNTLKKEVMENEKECI